MKQVRASRGLRGTEVLAMGAACRLLPSGLAGAVPELDGGDGADRDMTIVEDKTAVAW
jgi:hypothetical protein